MFKHPNVYFLSLMSQYIKKGDINSQDSELNKKLIKLFDAKQDISSGNLNDLAKFLFYVFQLCKNGEIQFDKTTIKKALNKCKSDKCKQMLNEYIKNEC